MKKIASFCVNHDLLTPGIYLSRIDGDVVTYDIRMVKPNCPPSLRYLCQKFRVYRACHLFRAHGLQDGILFSCVGHDSRRGDRPHSQLLPVDFLL